MAMSAEDKAKVTELVWFERRGHHALMGQFSAGVFAGEAVGEVRVIREWPEAEEETGLAERAKAS
jgi:hypothetical protein